MYGLASLVEMEPSSELYATETMAFPLYSEVSRSKFEGLGVNDADLVVS